MPDSSSYLGWDGGWGGWEERNVAFAVNIETPCMPIIPIVITEEPTTVIIPFEGKLLQIKCTAVVSALAQGVFGDGGFTVTWGLSKVHVFALNEYSNLRVHLFKRRTLVSIRQSQDTHELVVCPDELHCVKLHLNKKTQLLAY